MDPDREGAPEMIDSHNIAAAARTTVRIPTASGDEIEAWVYRPEGDGPRPAVVMALEAELSSGACLAAAGFDEADGTARDDR
jgi:hypothetical protein